MASYALGVDLGTTFTAASVHTGQRPEVVTLGAKSLGIPSIVYVLPNGEHRIGEEAIAPALEDPTRLVYEFKRHIGSDTDLLLPDGSFPPTYFSTLVLRWVLERVVQRMHDEPPAAVAVTHPAHWSDHHLARHREVLRDAGVPHALTVSEPEAAAIFYATQAPVSDGEIVAVYDLGGGTFDTAVVRRERDGFAILGEPGGIGHLGGADFDKVVFAIVNDHLDGAITDLDFTDPEILTDLHLLAEECTRAKEQLSANTHVTVPVRVGSIKQSVRVTRTEFERALRPRIAETITTLEAAVRSAGQHPSDLSRVLLVGGSSRIPLVRAMVQDALAVPVSQDSDPVAAVAIGASIFARVHGPFEDPGAAAAPPPALEPAAPPPPVRPQAAAGAERADRDVSVWIRGDMSPVDPPAPASQRAPTLRVEAPGGSVVVLTAAEELWAGRGADNGIVLPDAVVSRNHGRFHYDDRDGWRFTDPGSRNGSYLDGTPLPASDGDGDGARSVVLPPRGVLRLGASGPELCFEVDAAQSPPGSTVRLRCQGRAFVPSGVRRFVVGRSATADLVVEDPTRRVSSSHLELRPSGTGWIIVDVSANGTFRRGAPVGVDPFPAVPGDRLRLGSTDGPLLEIEDPAHDRAASPADRTVIGEPSPRRWWRNRRFLGGLVAGAVVLGVLGIGLVAAGTGGGSEGDEGASTTTVASTTSTVATTASTASTTTAPPQTVEVPGNEPWTDSGLVVDAGERLVLSATGQVRHNATDPASAPVGPAGVAQPSDPPALNVVGEGVYTFPPGHGGLVGWITPSSQAGCPWDGEVEAVFGVGEATEVTAARTGRLCLGINDFNRGNVDAAVENNDGSFVVTVRRQPNS